MLTVLQPLLSKTEGIKTYLGVLTMIAVSILKTKGLIDEQTYQTVFAVGAGLALYGRFHVSRKDKEQE